MNETLEDQFNHFKKTVQEIAAKEELLENRLSLLERFAARNNLYFLAFDREERVLCHNLPSRKNLAALDDAEYILGKDIVGQIRESLSMPPGAPERELKNDALEFTLFAPEPGHNGEDVFFLRLKFLNHPEDSRTGEDADSSRLAEAAEIEDIRAALNFLNEIKNTGPADRQKEACRKIQDRYLPLLERLYQSARDPVIGMCLEIIKSNLKEVIAPSSGVSALYQILTPSEIKVAEFIRMGKSSQDIADALDIARKTVENHRNSLRDKLGLKNKSVNLRSYLLNLDA